MFSSLLKKNQLIISDNDDKIVYMPGVFDLFHIGHLRAIQNARQHGASLIIGVQSDESALKQKNRSPVISCDARKKILFNIKGVDWVISYDDPDQSAVLKIIRPHKFACNESYGNEDEHQRATLATIKSLGIEVVRIPYMQGISTTYIKKSIQKD